MDATPVTSEITPCSSPLPDLEIPMISTMLTCLGREHQKLDEQILPLALAATRLASDPGSLAAEEVALAAWNDIRDYLYSHLQIEDALVFSWGEGLQAISSALVESLKKERHEMRRLVAGLQRSSSDRREPQTIVLRHTLAQTLLALAHSLDLHIARYDGEVLPSIRRELFAR